MAGARRIELTAEEEQTLRMWTGAGTTERRPARRARVILSVAEVLPIKEVGKRCGMSEISIFKWKRRFLELRLGGLSDQKRRGRPATITAEERLSVIDLATSTPEKGKTPWMECAGPGRLLDKPSNYCYSQRHAGLLWRPPGGSWFTYFWGWPPRLSNGSQGSQLGTIPAIVHSSGGIRRMAAKKFYQKLR